MFFYYNLSVGKKRGAPTKPPENRKSTLVLIRFTRDQRDRLEAAADGNISAWARPILLRPARHRPGTLEGN
jgi:hypothetical protein